MDESQDDNAAERRHDKPLLTVEQQIAHMKAKGITFELCTEEDAAQHLRTKCQLFRVYAYRKLFPKHVGGLRDGQYANLDFGHLKELSNLDRKLRDVLLPMTLDVEHFAKVRLLAAAEDHAEDGYAIMRDYREASTEEQRKHLKTELKQRRNDPYAGAVVRKYQDDMPVWAFCEVVSFGTFTDLLRFRADRWDDKRLRRDHYQYKDTRQVRNASAHALCACAHNGSTPSSRAVSAQVPPRPLYSLTACRLNPAEYSGDGCPAPCPPSPFTASCRNGTRCVNGNGGDSEAPEDQASRGPGCKGVQGPARSMGSAPDGQGIR